MRDEREYLLHRKRERKRLKRLRDVANASRVQFRYISPTEKAVPALSLLAAHGKLTDAERRTIRKNRERRIETGREFSIISNPRKVIDTVCQLAACHDLKLTSLYFDHSALAEVDLASESLLDLVAIELKRQARGRRGFRVQGVYPRSTDLRRYMKAVGVIKNLELKHEFLTKEQEAKLRIFQMRSKATLSDQGIGSLDRKGSAIKDFADHINNCLRDHKRRLTHKSRQRLLHYTGEIIGNAEDHSGYDEWSIVGYLDNEHQSHLCEIAIFNFGKTIAQTFIDLPGDSFTRKQIQPYIDAHQGSGWFGPLWALEDLLTLAALQGDISTKNTSAEMDRGQGTVDLIEFFQKVHRQCVGNADKSKAEMVVVSGSTHILFDGTYDMKNDAKGRKVIAFNAQNDLAMPPDKRYITNLGSTFFPGTIIYIRFPMVLAQQTELIQE